MQNKSNNQKILATAAVIIIALVVSNIIFGVMTDDGSGIWTLSLIFYGVPICLALGVLSFVYLKNDAKNTIPVKKKFVSASFSPTRILMIVSGIFAAGILLKVLWVWIPLLLTPNAPEPYTEPYVEPPAAQVTE
jgi:hypothetical protein